MSEFAAAAVRLAGLAGVSFGWSPGIFWNATPAELAALVRALKGDAPAAVDRDTLARLEELFPDG